MAAPVETPLGTITADHFRPGRVRHEAVVGPKFLFALFNPGDRMHPVSRAFLAFIRDGDLPYRRLVVNEHVIDEAATRLKKRAGMDSASRFLETLAESSLYVRESVSDTVFEQAIETFTDWTDLDASFTDFVVATQMEELGIEYIATHDQHYAAFDVTTLPYRD
jgi:predicted nucleic acid-binding protein